MYVQHNKGRMQFDTCWTLPHRARCTYGKPLVVLSEETVRKPWKGEIL